MLNKYCIIELGKATELTFGRIGAGAEDHPFLFNHRR